jgi:hypothetical protein
MKYITQITIFVLIIGLVIVFKTISTSEATYLRSNITNKEYLVQNLTHKEEATKLLGTVEQRINTFKNHLKSNITSYPDFQPYIKQFCDRIKNLVLIENPPDGKYTSYTVNKGDEIALCLRSRYTHQIHDINLIMYVVLHELSHVACPEQDHTELFKKIFKFFLGVAISLGLYVHINYAVNPHEYCGLIIREDLVNARI